MTKTFDLYKSYLDELSEKHPQDEPVMRAAINAFDSIQALKKTNPHLIQSIVLAASDRRKMLYTIAVGFLDQLTCEYKEARDAVAEMAEDKKSHVRINAIMCIGSKAPKPYKLELLTQALGDKNPNVRKKAADWAGRQRLKELVPNLEDALEIETNIKASATIDFVLRLLRDGYILKTQNDGSVCITAFTPNGTGSRWYEQTEFDQRGIQSIIDEINSDPMG